MKKSKYTDEQVVRILKEVDAGAKVAETCRKYGISEPTYYAWKRKYGSMNEPDVKRLRELEKENARLKRLLAERELAIDVMKEFLEKK